MERKAAQQNKNASEELKQGLLGKAKVNKVGERSRSVRNLYDSMKLRERSIPTLLEKTRQNNDTKKLAFDKCKKLF